MFELQALSLWIIIAGFAASAAVIGVAGTMLAARADVLADRIGWGEALVGAVLLGGSTSLPGILTSVVAAAQGYPSLSIANAVGGIAVQTAFLAVADFFYRRVNLEHAAASATNLSQGSLLVALLAVPLAASAGPDWTLLGVHPATVIILGGYSYGIYLVRLARDEPMWFPRRTRDTQDEAAEKADKENGKGGGASRLDRIPLSRVWAEFGLLAAAVAVAGLGVAEMVDADRFVIATTILMVGVLLLGLLRREKIGPGGIGFESVTILVLYVAASLVMALA